MMAPASSFAVVVLFFSTLLELTIADSCNNCTNIVLMKPYPTAKYFTLPASDDPIVTWMDIQQGIYPNTSAVGSTMEVGKPMTLFIYMKDSSKLYDLKVTDCWAHDNEDFEKSKYRLHLTEEHPRRKNKLIDKWHKVKNPKGSTLGCFMYTDFPSFKFPDRDVVYLKCDIQLCFKSCGN